jgi:hypothetical protein
MMTFGGTDFERNSDTWGFDKGALSANVYFFGNHSWATGAAANPVLGSRWRNRWNGRKNMVEQRGATFPEISGHFGSEGEFGQQTKGY